MEILNHVRKNGLGMVKALAEGEHKIKQVKREVRKNPWMYVGAASAAALVLGFALGKKK